ncbi:MAG: AraC family transcriptional regulator, partial [Bacteroidales bacterium]|nr:AraC family transcriptional regulator [Bacteroidales bacterium]
DQPIFEIADRLDFQSATFFSRFFKRETGITPKEYRNSARLISR